MPKYIDADLLIRKINSKYIDRVTTDSYKYGYNSAILEIELDIEDVPAADVQPVRHGFLLKEKHTFSIGDMTATGSYPTCSCCGSFVTGYEQYNMLYCPHCGAKMDGGDSREN